MKKENENMGVHTMKGPHLIVGLTPHHEIIKASGICHPRLVQLVQL